MSVALKNLNLKPKYSFFNPGSSLTCSGALAGAGGGHSPRTDQQHFVSGAQSEGGAGGAHEARPAEGRAAPSPLPGGLQRDRQTPVASPSPGAGGGLGVQPDLRGDAQRPLLQRGSFLFTLLCSD